MVSLGFLILGLILLVIGGEAVVRGASSLANTLKISPLVIGLTVVAYGTSAPELGVSIMASLRGNPEIAVANVLGSNIFNTLLILGLCSLFSPLIVNLQIIKKDVPILIILSGLTWLLSLDGRFSHIEGAIFLVISICYTIWLVWEGKEEDLGPVQGGASKTDFKIVLINLCLVMLGIGVLILGSKFLVDSASAIALDLGVSKSLIGLTVVAAGTSLPELVASLAATLKGRTDMAIGNIIGSNIFNLLFILGGSSLFSKTGLIIAPSLLRVDMVVMVATALICYPFFVSGKILSRREGIFLLAGYVGYTVFLALG